MYVLNEILIFTLTVLKQVHSYNGLSLTYNFTWKTKDYNAKNLPNNNVSSNLKSGFKILTFFLIIGSGDKY